MKGEAMRLYLRILGWIVALLGLFFAVAGAELAWLGGSLYYLLAGLAMIAAGILLSRSDRRGALIYALVWLATWLWAVWEVGFDGLQLIPRVVAPTVLMILVAWPWLWRSATRPPARRMAATAVIAGLVLAGAYAAFAPRTLSAQAAVSAATPKPSTGDWTHYGGTLAGDRYSSRAQITPANVGQLQLAWTHRTGDLVMPDEAVKHLREYHSEATPIHIGGTLYTCTPHSYVEAIDATTGAAKWRWHTDADITGNSYLVCRGVSYYEAPAGTACAHRIFAPTFDAKMYALDADTGKPCAGFGKGGYIDLRDQMGVSPAAFQISTSPPVVANGRLIIGERIIDNVGVDEPAGVVRAYDPISGAPVWAWDMGRGDDAIKPLTGDAIYTRGTPNVWGAMTADAANGIVYLGTGNATPDYWIGRRRPFDDKYGTSIVALDIATGKMRWHRQLVHRDMWDMDVPVGPSLVDLPLPGGGIVPALVQTTKMGQVYLLNRLTGAPLAAIVEKPVSTRGGIGDEAMSPTQPFSVGMPSFTPPAPSETTTWGATPIDQLICRIQFRKAHAAGIYAPIGTTDIIGHPAFDGVTDWGGGAVDPERAIFTVNTMEMPFRIRLVRADSAQGQKMIAAAAKGGENAKAPIYYQQFGTPYVAVVQAWIGPFGAPCSAPPWGKLTAVDLKTRQVMWTRVLGTARDTGLFGSHLGFPLKTGVPNLGGSIITRGGLVFIGATTDQYLRAFDLRTGAELWKARLPAGAQATPMTYQGRDGRQYVVITAGGHGALGTRYGDYTLAFALPKTT
ncbi:membrane-bound PQQ-dependent dehydrogenase, glucose/quinate/shikimate family [Sphingomonas sp. MMSM20]|uniref:membrane-bound PQQ-dependent dehydrogenase, glucose/quinate/shikimate family n=1 Tax=Sphingomonas lycopersici TaxID=2951807 RepID=UPI002238D55D|nr:membrane-bound PQQ-dependent dehydrogenase, glucose/quinate/shikimate family [Sphingomonas lycopersici]MCW6528799.1 membrane-bound PQQ-dependent dehydrogenase, glucose/quinate/shikimate family [Sphingomonas lycopersici]